MLLLRATLAKALQDGGGGDVTIATDVKRIPNPDAEPDEDEDEDARARTPRAMRPHRQPQRPEGLRQRRSARVAGIRLQLAGPWPEAIAKYNPNQPRAFDGKWTVGGGAAGAMVAAHIGQGGIAAQRFKEDAAQRAFMKPLTQAEMTGQTRYLDNPEGLILQNPSTPTDVESNANPDDVATFVAGADPGPGLNGVPFAEWTPPNDWTKVEGQGTFAEPPAPDTKGKRLGAGVIIEEPDGRVWTTEPAEPVRRLPGNVPEGRDRRGPEPPPDGHQRGLRGKRSQGGVNRLPRRFRADHLNRPLLQGETDGRRPDEISMGDAIHEPCPFP